MLNPAMAELTSKERLQPSLLDRLTDDEPDKTQESRDQRVLSANRLRECVRLGTCGVRIVTRVVRESGGGGAADSSASSLGDGRSPLSQARQAKANMISTRLTKKPRCSARGPRSASIWPGVDASSCSPSGVP